MALVGLCYELALGTLETFLLGDPMIHFAMIIGVYMFSLGVGAYLSRYVERLNERFVDSIAMASILGGSSGPILLLCFSLDGPFQHVLLALTLAIGLLIGVQLPLLIRIAKHSESFDQLLARALAVDYLGALVGSLLFSLLLLPRLGLCRSTIAIGLVNAVLACVAVPVLGQSLPKMKLRLAFGSLALTVMLAEFVLAPQIDAIAERAG